MNSFLQAKLNNELKHFNYADGRISLQSVQSSPTCLLPVIHYAILEYSRFVARIAVEKNYELMKDDLTFLKNAFKFMQVELGVKPSLTPLHFLSPGFVERKVILVTELVRGVRRRHDELQRVNFISNLKPVDPNKVTVYTTSRNSLHKRVDDASPVIRQEERSGSHGRVKTDCDRSQLCVNSNSSPALNTTATEFAQRLQSTLSIRSSDSDEMDASTNNSSNVKAYDTPIREVLSAVSDSHEITTRGNRDCYADTVNYTNGNHDPLPPAVPVPVPVPIQSSLSASAALTESGYSLVDVVSMLQAMDKKMVDKFLVVESKLMLMDGRIRLLEEQNRINSL